MTLVIGIDPGQTGAIALVGDHGVLAVEDMPVVDKWVNPALLHNIVYGMTVNLRIDLAVVEKVRSMPGGGVAGMFKFGAAWGMVVQAVAHLPIEQPTPAMWKRALGLSKSKDASRALAIDLWPADADRFARVKDDGRAEACLLAAYGLRLLAERRGAA